MGHLYLILVIGILIVVLFHLACFSIALYEALNLPEAQHARLTPAAFGAALREFAVETLIVLGFVLAVPLGYLPWRRVVVGSTKGLFG